MVATNGNGVSRKIVSNEIASVDRDFNASFNAYGRYFLRREDAAILAKGKGKRLHEIFRDTEKDTKLTEGLAQRYGAVLARETVVEPASQSRLDKKVALEVRSQINALNRRNAQVLNSKSAIYSFGGFDAFTLNMLDAIYMGYSVGEIDWQSDGKRNFVRQIWNREQSRFIFDVADGGYELRLLTQNSPIDGEELPARKFLVNSHGSKIGNPYGEPLAERLFWWVFFKRQEIRFWLTFSDKYGSPTLRGTYQTERQRDRLLDIMNNVAQQAGVALPEGVSLDILAAATSHTTTYQDLCHYCDSQIIEAILLQNLTTNVQGGSYAAAETHFEVRTELTDSDANLLSSGPYNDLANWVTEFNFGIDATPPLVYRPRVRVADEARARRDQILVGLVGRPLSEEYLATFYDAQFVSEEELTKKQAEQQAIAPPEEPQFDFAESKIKIGTTVSWKWQSGTATGKVIKIFRDRTTLKLDGTSVTRNGTQNNPAILIEQESGARALKLASEVSLGADYAEEEEDKDPADYYAIQAMKRAAPIFDGWLNTLEDKLFEGASSLEEIRDRIDSIYSELPAQEFSALVSDLLLAGYGAGSYQVLTETGEGEDFAESGNIEITAPEQLSAIRRILAKFYTDGIDTILIAYVDEDGDIQGVFLDYINRALTKRFAFQITDDNVSYKLLNPSQVESANYSEEETLDFAAAKQCKKGIACGNSCISANKVCKQATTAAQTQTKQAIVAAATGSAPAKTKKSTSKKTAAATTAAPAASQAATTTPTPAKKTGTKKTATSTPAAVTPASSSPIKTNQTELNKKRNDLVKRLGQKTVEGAEKNVQKILNSDDTNVFVRVNSTDTLEKILGDRFKTSAELGTDTHNIPYLIDGYQKARNRVEAKTLGYDEKTSLPEDRPIYGYLGGNKLNGASHANVADAYGSIALKMKPAVKDRATFTGADSFKSGIASEVKNDGTPPPPNAASLVSTTRHGYDRDKLPKHYPSYYSDDSADDGQLRGASRAKNIDDLVPNLAITGNAYMEAQIHGKVTPSDIAEMHFSPSGVRDRPTAAIAKFAKDNGVDLYVNGKKLSSQDLDDIITPRTKTKSKVNDLNDAIERGDFDSVSKITDDIHNQAQKLKLASGEKDLLLKQLFSESGFDGLPTVGTEQDVTNTWKQGGTLMVRGVAAGFPDKTQYLKQFQTSDYFVGNGIYGNGTYVGHAGKVVNGKFVGYDPKTAKQDAKRAFDEVATHGYITPGNVSFRMALTSDATVVTQSELLKQRSAVETKIEAWKKKERAKILKNASTVTAADVTNYNNTYNKIRSDYSDAPQIKIKKSISIPGGPPLKEVQSWQYASSSGKSIKVEVEVAQYGNSRRYYVLNEAGNAVLNLAGSTKQNAPDKAVMDAVFTHVSEKEALARLKLEQVPVIGAKMMDATTKKDLKRFDARYARALAVLGISDPLDQDGAIGRFAVIRGIDAVALNQSYQPETFMNLLNRSKVVIQKDELPYSKGQKTGAL